VKKAKITQERPRPPRLKQYEALIFITGAATLSLEVLASRIMTPYFGVSLYIWSGILSITLIFLALGYQWGGQISRRRDRDALQLSLLAAPLWAALAIVLATAVYPVAFPLLTKLNLVIASFLAGIILLALPLIALSAMNPLLIAFGRDSRAAGDGGAGRVFFISTVGSVAGVLLTAFLLIPHLTNFRSLLWMSLGMALTVAGMTTLNREIAATHKRRLICGCVIIAVLGGGLLASQRAYLKLIAGMSPYGKYCEVLAEYTSVFGNIKVVVDYPSGGAGKPNFLYLQDGLFQNIVTADGVALDHTTAMTRLIQAYAPAPPQALVLGLAAGLIPRYLQRQGLKVTAVDINPNSLQAATEFFGFDPRKAEVYQEDARTFVRRHPRAYNLVVADLFQGDCTPDYLLTVEFFREVQACLRPGGVLIMNTFVDLANERANETILATVGAVFPHVLECRTPPAGLICNAFIVAADIPLSPEAAIKMADSQSISGEDYQTLKSARIVTPAMLKNVRAVSDDHNIFSILLAGSYLRFRRGFNKETPPNLLVN
jgi:spermidine synthase